MIKQKGSEVNQQQILLLKFVYRLRELIAHGLYENPNPNLRDLRLVEVLTKDVEVKVIYFETSEVFTENSEGDI